MGRFLFVIALLFVQTVLSQVAFDDDNLDVDDDVIFEKFAAGSTDDLGRLFDLEKQLLASLDWGLVKAKKDDIEKKGLECLALFLRLFRFDFYVWNLSARKNLKQKYVKKKNKI